MSRTLRIAALAAAAALALPAVAGPSWPPTPPRKASVNAPAGAKALAAQNEAAGDFEYVGGDAGWQLRQPRYENGKLTGTAPRALPATAAGGVRAADGFEFIGGEPGWQLAPHKYDFVNGRFAMSDECDHAVHAAQRAPTPAQLDEARRLGGG